MKHSSLAIWIALGATFMGLFFTFIALLASKRKKAMDTPPSAGPTNFEGEPPLPDKEQPT